LARFTQKRAEKGSQKWIQKLINERPRLLGSRITQALGLVDDEEIRWLSPLESDDYAEYRDEAFLQRLGAKLETTTLSEFWPREGPQWDALGRSSSGKLFLVEAKSHIPELISSLQARDQDSADKIPRSLGKTRDYLGSKTDFDWSKGFYQYTNRLAHLYLLRENKLPAYLVFVYFLNDSEMKGPKTADEWRGALKLLHTCLGIRRHRLQKFIIETFVDSTAL
jgi:hypothetical protein